MTAPDVTLRIDHSGTAFGATPYYSDATTSLMADSLVTTWGAQDEQSEPTPRTCNFELANADGAWTPGQDVFPETFPTSWPPAFDIGAPVNVQVTVGATDYDRFTGFVDSIEPTWPGGTQSWSTVQVSCTDITARLALGFPLRSLVDEEILANDPLYFYPLDEPSGATGFGDISTNAQPAGTIKYGATPGSVTLGEDALLPDATTGASFGGIGAGAAVISLPVMLPTSGDFTLLFALTTPTEAPASQSTFCFLSDQNMASPTRLRGYIHTDGAVRFEISDPVAGTQTVSDDVPVCNGGPLFVAFGCTDGRKTFSVNIGDLTTSVTVGTAFQLDRLTTNQIGGIVAKGLSGQFAGVVSKAALFTSDITGDFTSSIIGNLALGTLAEYAGERFARLAGYAGLTTTGLPVGEPVMHQNTNGSNITEALAKVARTEGGVSYVLPDGSLTFTARADRYNATAGLTLTDDDLSPEITVRRDRQGLANEMTVSRDGGATQRVVDLVAQASTGRFDGGSLDVASWTDFDAYQNAAWRVGTRKNYTTRIPAVKVNLLRAADAVREDVLAADIGTLVAISGLPPQAPATTADLFIEGGSERIGCSGWDVEFFTSPELPPVFTLDDPVLGLLDSGNRVAF